MKKISILIGVILLGTVFWTACSKTGDHLSIATNVPKYTPTMSSVQGFTLTPVFSTDQKYQNLVYHWRAERGGFISPFADSQSELTNQGAPVLWSPVEQDQLVEIKDDFKIILEVTVGSSQKILAQTELTIYVQQGFYLVK